eukprot:GHVH01000174.1.p1 GENE.GHVH01000174.1~~GHVH01000174.1.p1  ORF type:complete len:350 (+),score=38.06 GHVH01000174.1:445-1494(+)
MLIPTHLLNFSAISRHKQFPTSPDPQLIECLACWLPNVYSIEAFTQHRDSLPDQYLLGQVNIMSKFSSIPDESAMVNTLDIKLGVLCVSTDYNDEKSCHMLNKNMRQEMPIFGFKLCGFKRDREAYTCDDKECIDSIGRYNYYMNILNAFFGPNQRDSSREIKITKMIEKLWAMYYDFLGQRALSLSSSSLLISHIIEKGLSDRPVRGLYQDLQIALIDMAHVDLFNATDTSVNYSESGPTNIEDYCSGRAPRREIFRMIPRNQSEECVAMYFSIPSSTGPVQIVQPSDLDSYPIVDVDVNIGFSKGLLVLIRMLSHLLENDKVVASDALGAEKFQSIIHDLIRENASH